MYRYLALRDLLTDRFGHTGYKIFAYVRCKPIHDILCSSDSEEDPYEWQMFEISEVEVEDT